MVCDRHADRLPVVVTVAVPIIFLKLRGDR
jgi:hypothetical protein